MTTLTEQEINAGIISLADPAILRTFSAQSINFCHSWAQIMPIVESLGISLLSYKEEGDPWVAQYQTFKPLLLIESINMIPTIALAECCYLALKEKAKYDR